MPRAKRRTEKRGKRRRDCARVVCCTESWRKKKALIHSEDGVNESTAKGMEEEEEETAKAQPLAMVLMAMVRWRGVRLCGGK